MTVANVFQTGGLRKSELFVLFFFMEAMVFAILPLSARIVGMSQLLLFHTVIVFILLVASWLLRKSEKAKEYWQVCYVCFVGSMAVLVSTLFSGDLIRLIGFVPTNPPGIAMAKLSESILRVAVILVLLAAIGASRDSIYLSKGRLKLGLAVGISGFIVFAAVAFVPFASQAGTLIRLLSLAPWIIIFVFSNGFMEELLFRGLFLQRYEPFLGKGLSNLLAAIVFTIVHAQANYVPDVLFFLVTVFPLALIWGYLMQKTDSLWGSALFHAGADCVIIFGIFASYSVG